jgi:hypothetical protein
LISTLVYNHDHFAMSVDRVQTTDRVTTDRILNEAKAWGLSRRRAQEVVTPLLDTAMDAIEAARDETPGVPDSVVNVVQSQLKRLREPSAVVPQGRNPSANVKQTP